MKQNSTVSVYKYTKISTKVTLGLGGNYCLITGSKATKAIISADKEPILSPKPLSWKNIPRLIMPSNHKGIKIVDKVTNGNLYNGI